MSGLTAFLRDYIAEAWQGPLAFRFVLQPAMAGFLGITAGLQDFRRGRPPVGWDILTGRGRRLDLLREAWGHIGQLFILALLVDTIYQMIVMGVPHPMQSLLIALVLAVPAYVVARGLTNRFARRRAGR